MAVTGIETNVFQVTSSTDVVTRHMNLASCRWVGATNPGHTCIMTDLDGNILFNSVANGPNYVDGWVFGKKAVTGIAFTAMTSGAMTIYKEPH